MAHKLTSEEQLDRHIRELNDRRFLINKELEEIKLALRAMGEDGDELPRTFTDNKSLSHADLNPERVWGDHGDGAVALGALTASSRPAASGEALDDDGAAAHQEELRRALFDRYDVDGDGLLDFFEFRGFLAATGRPGKPFETPEGWRELVEDMRKRGGERFGLGNKLVEEDPELVRRFMEWDLTAEASMSRALGHARVGLNFPAFLAFVRATEETHPLAQDLDTVVLVEEALVGIARYIHKRRARVVDVFRSIDHDGGGTIDREELEWGLKRFGMDLKDGQLDMVVRVFDADGSGNIDFKEFNAAVKYAHRLLLREVQKAKDKRAQARSDAAAKAKAKAAEKRESERRQKQHMQLAKMERDRKMKDGILEEVRAMNRPAAATIANAIVAKGDGGGRSNAPRSAGGSAAAHASAQVRRAR